MLLYQLRNADVCAGVGPGVGAVFTVYNSPQKTNEIVVKVRIKHGLNFL